MRDRELSSRPLRVIVLSPPIEKSGGIGTLYRYARENFPADVEVEFIDTRGYSKNPWWSILTVIRALVLVTWRRMTGKVDIIHLNLGARGAAIRKLSLSAWVRYILHVPFVLQLHAPTFGDFLGTLPKFLSRSAIHIMNEAEQILALGEVWKELLISLGCQPEKVRVFVMGVPDLHTELTSSGESAALSDGDLDILFAGELGERKGLPQLIEAMAMPGSENIRAIVCGDGDVTHWRGYAQRHGVLERVALLGLVEPSVIHELLGLADALVLPSRAEGLPVSVLEALSAGKMIICSAAGSLGEFITDGKEAIFIADQNPISIGRAFQRALELTELDYVNAHARQLWTSTFDVRSTTQALTKLWRDYA